MISQAKTRAGHNLRPDEALPDAKVAAASFHIAETREDAERDDCVAYENGVTHAVILACVTAIANKNKIRQSHPN